ncbi:nucleoside recognition domain-containing protein [Solemya pervernicosa gill symbiont]|uniref:Ferrous iron transport protein B n=2 Tax=Gammaproteobacteria incertae sedis TaxID=118884 RepID=A0A1T2L4J6_9GAMM|nr:ferrous iron transporter B [Candidatus Reidiella endopervernicosa]OOZ39994.1 nucleoside recognition domain-containing protein [Solemya pervernicosa gill symbiont]QKQ27801.1 ferrous iron transporter B [Candidatus Reidiella endopervernicosa]
MISTKSEVSVPLQSPLFRGDKRLRIALIGQPNSGKSTLFKVVSSTEIYTGELAGTERSYRACSVQIGMDEAMLVDLPSIQSLHNLSDDDQVSLKYLLWGDERPAVSRHESDQPPAPFAAPDVLIQVVDATALDRNLELSLELSSLGRPMVIALNMMDEAREKGIHININALSEELGVPVVPTVALMGHGIADVFKTAVHAVRQGVCPQPQPASKHICDAAKPLSDLLQHPGVHHAFNVPHAFLLMQLVAGDRYFTAEIKEHFSELSADLTRLRGEAEATLPRSLEDELHADRHHRAAVMFEGVTRLGGAHEGSRWKLWLDELFLHPRWGLVGSLLVFAAVLFIVFEVSAWLDSMTAAKLIDAVSVWQPTALTGVVGKAVVDGLIGLVGIVVPYMIPLVVLLVVLEESGVMQRIAFVVDRGFHQIGLHGGVAVPFLLGLGCNVPAISAAAHSTKGHERFVSAVLITFVPCSARSAIILALAGKYLGGLGVFMIFAITVVVIALMGRILTRSHPDPIPGQVQEIPPYALPKLRGVLQTTWLRTSDILTIVTPLLVGGSVVLALLSFVGADAVINKLLMPVTSWWLGLPLVLGVPILFGVLRKELSLLMIYQALGTFEIGTVMDWVQITTFLIFLTFYVPCVSTFAVMLKTLRPREAFYSVGLSVSVALVMSGVIRLLLELFSLLG